MTSDHTEPYERKEITMEDRDIIERLHALEVAQAAGAATLAGAQATQAAALAGATATQTAAQAGTVATGTAMAAGNMATMVAGGIALIAGIFIGVTIRAVR